MTNPQHNPARLVIAGAMYWNEISQTYFCPLHTAETTRVEGFTYEQFDEDDKIDFDLINGDIYIDEGGDGYYYDGTGADVVRTAGLYLQDPIETLKDLMS